MSAPKTNKASAAKKVSIVTSAYNEEGNVREFYERVTQVMSRFPHLDYEIIYADNASADKTKEIAKDICSKDSRFKLIVNARNVGHVRSPTNALFAASGDAIVSMVSDLQDPPERIADMISLWEAKGCSVVALRKMEEQKGVMAWLRGRYYALMDAIGEAPALRGFTGFGLYEKRVIDIIKETKDPEPYVRGLISEIGLPLEKISYEQAPRKSGFSKHRFLNLVDFGLLGITSMSKAPLRALTLAGFGLSAMSLLLALGYLVAKILFWDLFPAGVAPMMIMLLCIGSFQIFAVGLLGEYLSAIHAKLKNRPMAVELERVNFGEK